MPESSFHTKSRLGSTDMTEISIRGILPHNQTTGLCRCSGGIEN